MRLLELFSGTHSIGKVAKEMGYEVYSLDKDLGDACPFGSGYKSHKHFKEDIMTWNYKQFPPNYFDVITASPVCLWWSNLRQTNYGKILKGYDEPFSPKLFWEDIERYGIPMVNKITEILEYFNPPNYWIENPSTSKMKTYLGEENSVVVDYCKYSDWGYKKPTRFWISKGIEDNFTPLICKYDCENMIKGSNHHKTNLSSQKFLCPDGKHRNGIAIRELQKQGKFQDWNFKKTSITKKHTKTLADVGGGSNRLERYRIPEKLVRSLLTACVDTQNTQYIHFEGIVVPTE